MPEIFRRLRYLMNRRRLERDLNSDMEFHREMAARAGGQPFGNTLRLREEAREAWGWMWLDRCAQDLRYAARKLAKAPGFTLAAILILAIGIGVNVAAFGFFNIAFLRSLPVRDPDTLLRFRRHSPQSYAANLPWPEVAFFRQHSRTLSSVMGLVTGGLTIEGEEKPILAHFVTANTFSELGSIPLLGRLLASSRDDTAGVEPSVVLSYTFWQRHFGAEPGVIGRRIRLNNRPAIVAGVAPASFSGLLLESPDLWASIASEPWFVGGSHLLTDFSVESPGVYTFGRIRPGLNPTVAEEELRSLAAVLRHQYPDAPGAPGIWDNETLPSKPAAYASSNSGSHHGTGTEGANEAYVVVGLAGALSILILAVACGNLGSLLLARGLARQREISIRVSVGAGRLRLVRQLFTESLALSLMGAAAGVALGSAVLRILLNWSGAPAWLNAAPDWRVLLFALLAGFAAAILFGLTPAFHVTLPLDDQRRAATAMRRFLLGAQVAGSCVLLIISGLLVRALQNAITSSPGFEFEHVVSIDPGLANHGYSPAQSRLYIDSLRSRLRALPGVEGVSFSSSPPLGNRNTVARLEIDGHPIAMHMYSIDPLFFQTMKIPVLRGRTFSSRNAKSIIVGESFARRAWPLQNPVGKQISLDSKYTVVGVVGSARLVNIQDSDSLEGYFLATPADLGSAVLLVRASGPPEGLLPFVSSIARSMDPHVLPRVRLLRTSFREKLHAAEKSAAAVSLLGAVALLLACLGIVGVVGYAVSQRTREIGIRVALGAKAGSVLSLVLRQFAGPVLTGIILGVSVAIALSRFARSVLNGVGHLDPFAYVAAIAVFMIAASIAAAVPTRRALRIEPMQALRHD